MTSCAIALFIFFGVLVFLCSCSARDTLTYDDPVYDEGSKEEEAALISERGRFALGFFTPTRKGVNLDLDGRRYVGIWYNELTPTTIVWVANREHPIPANATGVFGIRDGNLCVFDNATGKQFWSTMLEKKPLNFNKMVVMIMDSGNLVLRNTTTNNTTVWQSFDSPTDTFLPGMLMKKGMALSCWRQEDDPGIGSFTLKQDAVDQKQIMVFKESIPFWRTGVQSQFFSSVYMPVQIRYLLSNFSKNSRTAANLDYNYTRLVIYSTGDIKGLMWIKDLNTWVEFWWEPQNECSLLNRCGNFGSCSVNNAPLICKCLPGFKPMFAEKWNSGNYTDGCAREAQICGKKRDTFVNFKVMNIGNPDGQIFLVNGTEIGCMNACLNDCRCIAYTYKAPDNLCWVWFTELNNLVEGPLGPNCSISARVSPVSVLDNPDQESLNKRSRRKLPSSRVVVAVLIPVIVVACIISLCAWRRKMKKRQDQMSGEQLDSDTRALRELMEIKEDDENGALHVHFYDYQSILDATENFSAANKLGQGGYGPVYKGKLPGGQEIAIKRLSNVSRQGLQAFKNEVMTIARLQHRNLVRLEGYCMQGEEKILVYEYMPNRSLDFFIFDRTRSVVLNWEMRLNIILGIARGLVYLHQDSRLRIIHRDLKASNILLDEQKNPKISDFGLARIIGGNVTESIVTSKIAGTYGYMSPEMLYGNLSTKSDVYSFGVLLLEIVSGQKNTVFNSSNHISSLLDYAWKLWTENRVLNLLDTTLARCCKESQVIKCVHVGLLCIQEDPINRPTMSSVMIFLEGESVIPPTPKQPPFLTMRGRSSIVPPLETNVDLTSSLEGR